jgi:hypothetical protein
VEGSGRGLFQETRDIGLQGLSKAASNLRHDSRDSNQAPSRYPVRGANNEFPHDAGFFVVHYVRGSNAYENSKNRQVWGFVLIFLYLVGRIMETQIFQSLTLTCRVLGPEQLENKATKESTKAEICSFLSGVAILNFLRFQIKKRKIPSSKKRQIATKTL